MTAAQSVGGLAADKADAVKAAAIASLPQQGVIYHGLEVMGGGSILSGLVLGAIGVFVIERDFVKAVGVLAGRRRADLFRLHAWRSRRLSAAASASRLAVALAYAVMAGGPVRGCRLGAHRALRAAHPEMHAAPAVKYRKT